MVHEDPELPQHEIEEMEVEVDPSIVEILPQEREGQAVDPLMSPTGSAYSINSEVYAGSDASIHLQEEIIQGEGGREEKRLRLIEKRKEAPVDSSSDESMKAPPNKKRREHPERMLIRTTPPSPVGGGLTAAATATKSRRVSFSHNRPMSSATMRRLDELERQRRRLEEEIAEQQALMQEDSSSGMDETPSAGGHLSQVYAGALPEAMERVVPRSNKRNNLRSGDLQQWRSLSEYAPEEREKERRRRQSETDRVFGAFWEDELPRSRPLLWDAFDNRDEVERMSFHERQEQARARQERVPLGSISGIRAAQRRELQTQHESQFVRDQSENRLSRIFGSQPRASSTRNGEFMSMGLGPRFRHEAQHHPRWNDTFNSVPRPYNQQQPSGNRDDRGRAEHQRVPRIVIDPFERNLPDSMKIQRWAEWCELFDALLEEHGVESARTMATLMMTAAGAEIQGIATSEGLFIRSEDCPPGFTVYTFLKSGIAEYFYSNTDSMARIMELENIKQKDGETASEFMKRLKECAKNCRIASPLLLQTKFLNGLRDDSVREMAGKLGSSLEEMLTMAIRGEALRDMRQPAPRSSLRVAEVERTGGQSTSSGMRRAVVHEVRKQTPHKPGTDNKRKQGKPPMRQRKVQDSTKKCENCGLEEHRSGNCPATNVTCHNCSRQGHYARCCRQRNRKIRLVAQPDEDKVEDPEDWD